MINRTDLLVQMGIYMSAEELEKKVEACILEAAKQNKRQVLFVIPEKTNKYMIDGLQSYLGDLGYRAISEVPFDVEYYLPGKKFYIEW